MNIGEGFSKTFVETTHGWWHHGTLESSIKSVSCGDDDQTSAEILNVAVDMDSQPMDDDHHTWVDDRHAPSYRRADSEWSQQNGHIIDEVLQAHAPDAFVKRKKFNVVQQPVDIEVVA